MDCLFVVFVAITVLAEVNTEAIRKSLNSYFKCDSVKAFEKKWKRLSFSYENTVANILRDGYGHNTMNVFMNRFQSSLLIASGYYHTDNQVKLVFKDMMLETLPHLYDVDVSMSLPSNVVSVDASVSKIIVHTSYILFRNQSGIIFAPSDQDPHNSSPFRFQQVRNVGDLAITIEGCSFSGVIVATLSGNSVNLGHNELRMKDCQYSVEIYKQGSGLPPVIANYLPTGEVGLNLETLLLRPLLEELIPKMQGVMFAEVNTSAILGKDLQKLRARQENIFENSKNFIDEIVRKMNKKSIERNMGTRELEDFDISWDDIFTDTPSAKAIKLTKMSLLGLDTVYASHRGGPIRLTDIEIIEQLRFSTLQVIGKISIKGLRDDSEFAVEISDLAVNINVDLQQRIQFEVLGWRFLEFSCPDLELLATESLVVGYLLNEVPKHIKSHLNSVYYQRINLPNLDYKYKLRVDGLHEHLDTHEIIENVPKQLNQKTYEHFKQNDVKVKLHKEEHDLVQINDPQSDKPIFEEEPGPDPNVDEVQDDKTDEKVETKSWKRAARTKRLQKNKDKIARKNRRANKIPTFTPKSIQLVDNEIQTN